MKFYKMSIPLILALTCAACSSRIEGNGSIEKLNRKTMEFTAIEVSGSIDFNYIKSNLPMCEIEADSNLLDNIKTEVNGKKLKVYAAQSYTTKHRVVVNCSSNNIDSVILAGSGVVKAKDIKNKKLNLVISGSGEFDVNQLKVDSLNLSITGSGDILASGTADYLNANVSGSGNIKSKRLNVKNSKLVVTGSGSVYNSTSNRVAASVMGSGDILIFGEPKSLKRSILGSGDIKVIKLK